MLNCSPQSSLPVPWPFWELRGCTAGDITLFKERAGVARSAQIIPAVKQNLIKVESFFFSLRLCHGVFLQSENYKLRTKRTHCCGKQGFCLYKRHFCVAKCLLGCAQTPFVLHRTDASYAFVPNAFITKRRDRPEFFSKEGLWSVVVYWDFVFGAALFVCATRPHCWTGGAAVLSSKLQREMRGRGQSSSVQTVYWTQPFLFSLL